MDEQQNSVLTIILGGGRGTRLFPLTQHRCKPAVPLAGTYRLVDIPYGQNIQTHCFPTSYASTMMQASA